VNDSERSDGPLWSLILFHNRQSSSLISSSFWELLFLLFLNARGVLSQNYAYAYIYNMGSPATFCAFFSLFSSASRAALRARILANAFTCALLPCIFSQHNKVSLLLSRKALSFAPRS
jgi:hypothetical protein